MNEFLPSLEFERKVLAAEFVPAAEREFVDDLRVRVLRQAAVARERSQRNHRLMWAAISAAVLLVVAGVLLVGPQNVVSALQQLIGWIPGVGLVEPSTTRILAEPVSVTRDGLTVHINQVIATREQTLIEYTLSVLLDQLLVPGSLNNRIFDPACKPTIAWEGHPNGLYYGPNTSSQDSTGMTFSDFFEPIPKEIETASLRLPCIQLLKSGSAPEDWMIPFRLKKAPPDFLPGVPVQIVSGTEIPSRQSFFGITAYLESVIATGDGYVVRGSFRYPEGEIADALINNVSFNDSLPRVMDGTNRILLVQDVGNAIGLPEPEQAGRTQWAYKIYGKDLVGPLTLSINSLSVFFEKPPFFSFEIGSNPSFGDEWTLNQHLDILGLPVSFNQARLILFENNIVMKEGKDPPGGLILSGLLLKGTLDPLIRGIGVNITDGLSQEEAQAAPIVETGPFDWGKSPDCGDFWGFGMRSQDSGIFTASPRCPEPIRGPFIRVQVNAVSLLGPWVIVWNPPK